MKKIYILTVALIASTFSFAQDRQVGEMEKTYDRLELNYDRSEDTLNYPSASLACGLTLSLYSSTNGGYVNGANGYGDTGIGQEFPLDGQADVVGFMVWYGAKESVDGLTQFAGSVTDKGNTPLGAASAHDVAAIDTTAGGANGWQTYLLGSAAAVTDTFRCVVAWQLGSDTVGVVSTVDPCGDGALEVWSDFTVHYVSESWGIATDLVVLALVDNLEFTGLFDTEVADFGVFQNGTNLHVNGIAFDAIIKNVQLIDLSGRTIKTWSIADQWDNYTFDVSDVPFGNYIISMNTSKGNYAQKFNLK